MIFPVALYGCEAWSLTLRVRGFENRVLRRIFGPKEGGTGRSLENTA